MRLPNMAKELETMPPPMEAVSILVAEDDKIVRHLLSRMILKKFPDVTVYSAENGLVGVELFKEHAPSLVLTDINMPLMDGLRMSRELRTISATAKIIVISASDKSAHCEKLDEIGIEGYFVKPIKFQNLFHLIEKCLDEIAPER